jgi:hypothetical protein
MTSDFVIVFMAATFTKKSIEHGKTQPLRAVLRLSRLHWPHKDRKTQNPASPKNRCAVAVLAQSRCCQRSRMVMGGRLYSYTETQWPQVYQRWIIMEDWLQMPEKHQSL